MRLCEHVKALIQNVTVIYFNIIPTSGMLKKIPISVAIPFLDGIQEMVIVVIDFSQQLGTHTATCSVYPYPRFFKEFAAKVKDLWQL